MGVDKGYGSGKVRPVPNSAASRPASGGSSKGEQIIRQNRQMRGYKMIMATPVQYVKMPKAAKSGPLGTRKSTEAALVGLAATGIAGAIGIAAGRRGGGGALNKTK